jgi:hypothetical protein
MAAVTLAGCAGQANPATTAYLRDAQQRCALGDQNQCVLMLQLQQAADQEAAADSQNKTGAAALGVGLLAILGAAVGVAAANGGGGGHYYRYHSYRFH